MLEYKASGCILTKNYKAFSSQKLGESIYGAEFLFLIIWPTVRKKLLLRNVLKFKAYFYLPEQNEEWKFAIEHPVGYGIPGCGVFKGGIQN